LFLYIVLPCFNEGQNLPRVFMDLETNLGGLRCRIIVVDDGSTDTTQDVCKTWSDRLPLIVLTHGSNLGLGAALATGLAYVADTERSTRAEDDIIVTMDADASHDAAVIPKMISGMQVRRADVVIASRFVAGRVVSGVPFYRQFLSLGASWLLRLVFTIPNVRDYTSGFRAFRRNLIAEIARSGGERLFCEEGFAAAFELLYRLHQAQARFEEVPIVLRYDNKQGPSKMRVWRTMQRYLYLVYRFKVLPCVRN